MQKNPLSISSLNKADIVYRFNHRCRHGARYLEHPHCYLTENPFEEKVGFIDIEATNLKADFGIVLCYCIKELGKDKIYEATINKRDLSQKGYLDKRVLRKCIEDMKQFTLLVGYYSSGFDIPFLRTRALTHGLLFPLFGEIRHKDIYYIVKRRFKLSSSRLENACRVLLGHTDKTRIDSEKWILALQGNPRALAYIVDHCRKDVTDLEKLYNITQAYSGKNEVSI